MKGSIFVASIIFFMLLVPAAISARNIAKSAPSGSSSGGGGKVGKGQNFYRERRAIMKGKGADTNTVEVAGSSLPDCLHACGSCFPCRLVMVSFVCATLEEAESCPMAYKCMCKHKSYPVP
ncbi:hypothetical protein UlMin_014387 [Ulmus minor]